MRGKVKIANTRLIPTRSELATDKRIGWPDMLEVTADDGNATVVAANSLSSWLDLRPQPLTSGGTREPERLLIPDGIPSRGTRVFEFIVEGNKGTSLTLRYASQWAATVEHVVECR